MLRRLLAMGLTVLFVLGSSALAIAQGRGGMGGASAFGSSMGGGMGGMGMSSMGRSGMGGMGMGGTGMSGMGMGGMGGMGMSGMGMSGMGMGGMGRSGMGGMGMGGMGASGFGGGAMGQGGMGGASFVGRDGGDMSAAFNQMGRAGAQLFSQMNRNMAGGNRNNNNNRNNQNTAQDTVDTQVRVRLNLGFTPARPTTPALASNIRTRLANVASPGGATRPEVAVDGNVIVLRGTVANENQRRVFEQLIAMEPGVTGIRNEIIVVPGDEQE